VHHFNTNAVLYVTDCIVRPRGASSWSVLQNHSVFNFRVK